MQGAALFCGQRQHLLKSDVLQGAGGIAKALPRCGCDQLQITGGREDSDVANAMVAQPGVSAQADASLENGLGQQGRAQPPHQHGVIHLPLSDVFQRNGVPIAPTLEGISGQVQALALIIGIESRPIHRLPGHVELGQGVEEGGPVALFAMEGRGPNQLFIIENAAGHANEGGMRPDLQKCFRTQTSQRLHSRHELHGHANMLAPIPCIQDLAGHDGHAGDVGDERDGRGAEFDLPGHSLEFIEDGVHQGRVEGVGHGEGADAHALRFQIGGDSFHQLLFARDDHQFRPVDAGDGHILHVGSDGRCHGADVAEHRGHAAIMRQRPHEPPAGRDEFEPVLQAHHSGDDRCDVLAHAVPNDEIRLQPPALPQPGQRVFDGEQRRLGVGGVVDGRNISILGIDDREQRLLQISIQRPGAVVQSIPESGLGLVKLAGHARILGALAGEQPGDGGRMSISGLPATDADAGLARGGLLQPGHQVIPICGHQCQTLAERLAAGVGGVGHIGQIGRGMRFHPALITLE